MDDGAMVCVWGSRSGEGSWPGATNQGRHSRLGASASAACKQTQCRPAVACEHGILTTFNSPQQPRARAHHHTTPAFGSAITQPPLRRLAASRTDHVIAEPAPADPALPTACTQSIESNTSQHAG